MNRAGLSFVASSVLCLLSQSVFAQRELKDIPVPDPELERKTFVVADGFEVNLFAADPKLHKPIQINFDPKGRLWVAASEVYPQIAPGQKASDKILILEDVDGDGTADKTTVFADGLLIPTAVEPGDGGAYVANSTELVHFKDTNGDDKADESRIVLSGFGTEDTHHILHTFRWGMDGMLYMNQSIYIHSHIETPYGVRRLNAGGIWQYRPETMQLEVFARGWVNTWGHAFDRWGQSFATDGAGGEGINYVVPGASYPAVYGVPRILHGLNPGSPKYCGLEIVDGRHLPDDWQGNLITHDFRGHRVCRFIVSDDGSGFAARQQPDLISSNHVAFRPIDVKQGPDGAIYIADWYNPIIQHGEVDFRDPRRDHTHGRIWRVTAKGRPTVPRPKLVGTEVAKLLDALKSPESFERQHAKRVLKELGGVKVRPALDEWNSRLDKADPQFEHHRLEALWMYQSLDIPNPSLLEATLSSRTPQARAAAVRVVPAWKAQLPNALAWLDRAMSDEHPRVRLETIRALSAFADLKAAAIALRAADQGLDQFADYALWQTSRELAPVWLPAVVEGRFDFEGSPRRLLFAAKSAEAGAAVPALIQKFKDPKTAPDLREQLLETVATLGNGDHLRLVFDLTQSPETTPENAATLLRTLANARKTRGVQPSGDLTGLANSLKSENAAIRAAAVDCVGAWKLESLRAVVTELAQDANKDAGTRVTALTCVAQLGGPASSQLLGAIGSSPQEAEQIRANALSLLVPLDPPGAAKLAIAWMKGATTPVHEAQVVTAFLTHKEGPDILAKALNGEELPEDVAKIALRTVSGSGRQEPKLVEALSQAGRIVSMPVALSPEAMEALVGQIKQAGNAVHGEQIFRRAELNCLKCHAIGGAGGKVGPDLVSIGSSAQVDYLVDSILQPNKAVKEGYHSVVVQTDDGKIVTGIKVRQTDTDLVLRDVEDREILVPLKAIEEQAPGTSLMPVGLVDKLTRAELIDLVRFLSELGKPGPYAAVTARVVRRWESLVPTNESYTRMYRTSDTQVISNDNGLSWIPVYSSVAGSMPVQDILDFTMKERLGEAARKVGFLRCRLNVTTAGAVGLAVSDTAGLQIWLDSKPLDVRDRQELALSAGEHVVTLSVNLLTRKAPVRLELYDVDGSKAQAQFVSGK